MELGVTAALSAGCIAGAIFLRLLFEAYAIEKQRESVLSECRAYYKSCSGELPVMGDILTDLDNMLSGSLDLEQMEAQLMLEQMNRPKRQTAAQDCYLGALLAKYLRLCHDNAVHFQFKLTIPKVFEKNSIDCIILYDCLLGLACRMAGGKERYIRIREKERFDIWHLQLLVSLAETAKKPNRGKRPEVIPAEEYRQLCRCLKWLLRKYHLKCRIKNTENQMELDITT